MFPRPRQLESEPALYDAAIKILVRRAHSAHEMKQALERRCADPAVVKNVLARLKTAGLIDDARYAKQFARQRTEGRKQGRFRVARELRARGVPDRYIDRALEEMAKSTDEGAVVRQRIERKLRTMRGEKDKTQRASVSLSLVLEGFKYVVARRELRSMTRERISGAEGETE